jgi:signal transduction histidine kinase
MAVVEVRDTGTGIKAEVLPELFEPFRTGKPRGLGLGLALARKIAHAHKGRAEGSNLKGGGASFRLLLPKA